MTDCTVHSLTTDKGNVWELLCRDNTHDKMRVTGTGVIIMLGLQRPKPNLAWGWHCIAWLSDCHWGFHMEMTNLKHFYHKGACIYYLINFYPILDPHPPCVITKKWLRNMCTETATFGNQKFQENHRFRPFQEVRSGLWLGGSKVSYATCSSSKEELLQRTPPLMSWKLVMQKYSCDM